MSENNFKFSSDAVPQAPVTVDDQGATLTEHGRVVRDPSRAEEPSSDADRIEAARALLIQRDRAANADPIYGGQHRPEFFQDRGFGSAWFARHLCFLSELLKTTLMSHAVRFAWWHDYNPSTGNFELNTPSMRDFSLIELQASYHIRLLELGISEVLIEEHSAQPTTAADDKAFRALSFEERMATFRTKA